MARCPGCFAPATVNGCLCTGSERRAAQTRYVNWCGSPDCDGTCAVTAQGPTPRCATCKGYRGPGHKCPQFVPCEACGSTKTAHMDCLHCATVGGPGTVSQRSLNGGRREVLRGIDALGILLRMSPEGPDDED